jgi:hypothetical protein
MHILQRTTLASALAVALGTTISAIPTSASADYIFTDWSGFFTMLSPVDVAVANTSYPYYDDPTWGYGLRTPVSGSLVFNTSTGAGYATVNPFDFLGSGPPVVHDFNLQAIGDGAGGQGTLVAGSLLFDWKGNQNISMGIILDAAGLFGGYPYIFDQTITGTGATPASDNAANLASYQIGPAPMATTTYNTNFSNAPGCVASNTCLAGNDTIGGSPFDNGPFPGYSANIDFTSIRISSVLPSVPVPAAAWLFGSGLLGLLGIAGRKRVSVPGITQD